MVLVSNYSLLIIYFQFLIISVTKFKPDKYGRVFFGNMCTLWIKDPISMASLIDQKGLYLAQDNKSDTFLVSTLVVLIV